MSLALILALIAGGLRYSGVGEPPDELVIGFAIALLLGLITLAISAAIKLAKGDIRLRPWDAARKAITLFLLYLGVYVLLSFAFSGMKMDVKVAIQAAAFAIIYSLFTTAYRKPA